jgi:hypothetical protein
MAWDSDADILSVFQSFGYTPTAAEIGALRPAFAEGEGISAATSAVANYVQAHQELAGAQSQIQGNLLSEQQAAQNSQTLATVLETQGQAAYDAAANVYTQAPKLFGSLTADQIGQYLAPAQAAFEQAQGKTAGDISSRGLGGSSIEAQALNQNLSQFMSQTLMTGLGIGQQQQQNQANVLQGKGQQLFGASGTATQAGLGYQSLANNSASANYNAAAGISGLAGASVNESIAQAAALKALNPPTQSFGGKLASGFEDLATQDILNLGQNLVGSIPGLGPMTKPGGSMSIPGLSGGIPGLSTGQISPTGQQLGSMGAAGSTLLPPALSLNPVSGLA